MIYRSFSIISLSVFLMALLWISGASGFETCKTSGLLDIKWSNPGVTFKINTSGGPAGSLSAIQAGMQTWTDVGTAKIAFVYGGATTKTSVNHGSNDGENIVVFGPMGQNGTLAENAYWYSPSTGYIIDSDIQFNTSYSWNTTGAAGYFDVQNVGTHEHGHSLCLNDLYNQTDSGKTMYGYAASGETKSRTLDQDDIDGITYLYPSPDIAVSPLNIVFGNVNLGTSSSQTAVVTNNGVAGLTIGTVAGLALPFSIVTDLCSGRTLAPAVENCSITVRFAPTSGNTFGSNLSIPSNDPDQNPATVGLSGTGVVLYTLTVNKNGSTGSGTVNSSPGGIGCGSDCTEQYIQGTFVTLTATPDAGSIFAGWSGGGCSGTGSCAVTVNSNTTVTAIFNMIPPTADFIGSPVAGNALLNVSFTDASTNNPATWLWSFGDGGTSTQQNPTHLYENPGTYTISLTAENAGGSDIKTTAGYITVNSLSVRIPGVPPSYYASIGAAYAAATDGATIQGQTKVFTENLDCNRNISVTIKGGYDTLFTANSSNTTIIGSLTISNGTVIIENIFIQ